MKKLLKALCDAEGKKIQVSRSNVQEILARLAELVAKDEELAAEFAKYVQRKAPKKRKKVA